MRVMRGFGLLIGGHDSEFYASVVERHNGRLRIGAEGKTSSKRSCCSLESCKPY